MQVEREKWTALQRVKSEKEKVDQKTQQQDTSATITQLEHGATEPKMVFDEHATKLRHYARTKLELIDGCGVEDDPIPTKRKLLDLDIDNVSADARKDPDVLPGLGNRRRPTQALGPLATASQWRHFHVHQDEERDKPCNSVLPRRSDHGTRKCRLQQHPGKMRSGARRYRSSSNLCYRCR